MSVFKYFTKIDVKHVRPVEGYCRVQYRGPEAKTTEVEARVALICASTDDGRCSQAVVDWVVSRGSSFQVGGPCINGTHKRQKFRS